MNRDFEHEDFEDFLKRNADGLRMKAPDAVWNKISKDLNKRRRRTVWGVGLALLITSVAGYFASTIGTDSSSPSAATPTTQQPESQTPVVSMNNGNRLTSSANNLSTTTASIDNTSTQETLAPVISIQQQFQGASAVAKTNNPHRTALKKKQKEESIVATLNPTFEKVSDSAVISQSEFTPTIVDSYTEFDEPTTKQANNTFPPLTETPSLPLTIESVVNSFSRKTKPRIETQVYVTPTISYRKLSENKSYLQNIDPNSIPANYPALTSSVNSNVVHKPDLGFEVGLAVKYPLTEKLKLRSGVQFNVNRYNVKAFSSNWTMATIALNSSSGADSLRSLSTYSNVSGYQSNWLQNFSLQVSVPVGIEYNFGGSEKLQLGMAYTVQPTYVLNDRSYIITTDYKRYTQVPWLIRRWNLNTAFETFITYQPGKTRWQLGPQVRYQLLSSFISEYPVKENLFDFGLKLGVSLGR